MADNELFTCPGAIPTEKGYEGYPCSICASINDEVVHGIPSDVRVLHEGDIITVDCSHHTPLSMGILQARILEWVAMPSSMGFS